MPRETWLSKSRDVFCDQLAQLGLVLAREHATEIVKERVTAVAAALCITEQSARRYVTEELLRELARATAMSIVDERPGASLMAEPRTIPVSVATLSRTITALSESTRVRVQDHDGVGVDGALDAISLLATMLNDHPSARSDQVMLPQAALTRAARLLRSAANLTWERSLRPDSDPEVPQASLAAAFERDAQRLRDLVSNYGISPEASPES
jgi:hypothetical protein